MITIAFSESAKQSSSKNVAKTSRIFPLLSPSYKSLALTSSTLSVSLSVTTNGRSQQSEQQSSSKAVEWDMLCVSAKEFLTVIPKTRIFITNPIKTVT